jgi:hypothetical protein
LGFGNPYRPQVARTRRPCCAALVLALTLALPSPARAETAITAQAVADDGAFLPYVPAPPQLGGLCLVDTGVSMNPDTADVVVDRTAIDGGSGSDVSPSTHGTMMAMMAGAPINSWGMVGTAPRSIQIVSVRILEPGQTTFPFRSYAAGITTCLQLRQQYNIRVINLSLGDPETPSARDYETIANAVQSASNYGVAVVAAAGNDDGGPLDYPAAYPSVLSVAAGDTQSGGGFCAWSNRGDGLRMIAPGCDLNGADPISGAPNFNYWQGSSESSAIDASALDALESYRSDLSPQAAEKDLTEAHNGVLDIAQAFRNAGLSQTVTAGEAAEPSTQATSSTPPTAPPQSLTPSGSMTLAARFPSPRAQIKRVRGHLILLLETRPKEAQAQIRYLGHRGRRSKRLSILRTYSGVFDSRTMPSSGVLEISLRYTDPYDLERASPWTTLKLPPTAAKTSHPSHSQ